MTVRKGRKKQRRPATGVLGAKAQSIALLWAEQEKPSRGPKPGLSIARIASAAIAIADAEGLAAVSMQRVADGFGLTTMALYRYVASKSDLVDLMFDAGMGKAPVLDHVKGGWRGKLTHWAREMSDLIHRHPWCLEVLNRLRVMGPNELGWLEAAVGALAGTGLNGTQMFDAIFAVVGHVRVAALYSVEPPDGSLTSAEWNAALEDIVQKHAVAYPALAAAIESGAVDAADTDGLAFGLARILDGIDALIAGRTTKRK